jgi:hypothetical protein
MECDEKIAAHIDALAGERDAIKESMTALSEKAEKVDALAGEVETLKAEIETLKTDKAAVEAKTSPAAIDALVAERVGVIDSAKSVFPALVADGLSIDDIRKAAVQGACPELKKDAASDEYYRAAFDVLVATKLDTGNKFANDVAKRSGSKVSPREEAKKASLELRP